MAEADDPCDWARDWLDVPVTSLPFAARHRLALHLNPVCWGSTSTEDGLPADWQGLAAKVGLSNLEIRNLRETSNPTDAVLTAWEPREGSTIGVLLQHLVSLEREDVLRDQYFRKALKQCSKEEIDEVSPDISIIPDATEAPQNILLYTRVNQVDSLPHCDAMIVHAYEDVEFVRQFLIEIERAAHMRFFIKFRDMMVGGHRYGDLAHVIRKKCRWVLLLMTPAFLEDEECQFCLKIAHAFSPGLREKLLLPVILQDCHVPDILSFVAFVDLTKPNIRDWQFNTMVRTLQNPLPEVSQEDLNMSDLPRIRQELSSWLSAHPSSSTPAQIIIPRSSSPQQTSSNSSTASSSSQQSITTTQSSTASSRSVSSSRRSISATSSSSQLRPAVHPTSQSHTCIQNGQSPALLNSKRHRSLPSKLDALFKCLPKRISSKKKKVPTATLR